MTEQTSMPVPEGGDPIGPCRWCGEPGVGMVEIEGAKFTSHHGIRVMARRPIEVPACADHIDIVDRQPKDEEQ